MNYRIQDFMKLIIPGMYVEAMIFGWYVFTQDNAVEWDKAKDLNSITLFLIPFVGYVIGYLLECIMSSIEHLFYTIGRRPSKTILKGCGLYSLTSKNRILTHHGVQQGTITNSKANEILQTAKQVIDRERVEHFRNNSMLARNIFGAQLLLSIVYTLITDLICKDPLFYSVWTITILFLIYWIHHTHVYVKYALAEYGNKLPNVEN